MYTHGRCIHDQCLNHEPDWEKVAGKHLVRGKRIFFRRSLCCGAPMIEAKRMQTERCKKCGRKEDYIDNIKDVVTDSELALCTCCGGTENMFGEDIDL